MEENWYINTDLKAIKVNDDGKKTYSIDYGIEVTSELSYTTDFFTDKTKIFIDKYKSFWWWVEYFFKDYPFLWSVIIWFIWWLWATILNLFLK